MEWNRNEALALAANSCSRCHGAGLVASKRKSRNTVPCGCVCRRIFRSCYARFIECVANESNWSVITKHVCSGPNRRVVWGMKNEEYVADFCLISRRHLSPDDHRVFRYHFLLGADWKLCCRRLGMDRGNFFHAVYRIESKLGRVFRELKPFPLYPLDEYFHASRRVVEAPVEATPIRTPRQYPVRPPVRLAA